MPCRRRKRLSRTGPANDRVGGNGPDRAGPIAASARRPRRHESPAFRSSTSPVFCFCFLARCFVDRSRPRAREVGACTSSIVFARFFPTRCRAPSNRAETFAERPGIDIRIGQLGRGERRAGARAKDGATRMQYRYTRAAGVAFRSFACRIMRSEGRREIKRLQRRGDVNVRVHPVRKSRCFA